MDPLSVMASVVGLLAAAGQVIAVLSKVKATIKDAPRSMNRTISEVQTIEISLLAIRELLLGLNSAPRQRITMIQVNQLLATLTEAVLTFSELEILLKPFATDSGSSMVERIKWSWIEGDISKIMIRLERHKSSFSLMLNIVQCESDLEAEQSRNLLHNLVLQLLESNQDISRRLRNLEVSRESESILTNCFRNENPLDTASILKENTENGYNRRGSRILGQVSNNFQAMNSHYSFEIDLNTSRVYRRTELCESDVSFTSSNFRTHAWSIFSGMSLSEISVFSALALPLYAYEIPNSTRYNFREHDRAVLMSEARNQKMINPPKQPKKQITESTTLSIVPAALEQTLEESQLRIIPSIALQFQGPTLQANTSRFGKMSTHKLVVLGDGDVGKTALTIQFTLRHFAETYDPTIEVSNTKEAVIDGESCILKVLDTAGQEGYPALRDQWIREGEGFLLVYCITNFYSFTRIIQFHENIIRVRESQSSDVLLPMMLVGNNSDRGLDREVSLIDGLQLARELGCEFIEVSKKDCTNVDRAFYDVVRQLRRNRAEMYKCPSDPEARILSPDPETRRYYVEKRRRHQERIMSLGEPSD